MEVGGVHMNDHQHAAIEQTRIVWHEHQFEHDCYGQDCAEDRRLYRAYQRAISGDVPEPGSATERQGSVSRAERRLCERLP
jgi:hypothetical protein